MKTEFLPSVSSSQDRATNQDVKRAREILGGDTASLDERTQLARTLARSRYFGYARRIQGSARRLYAAQRDDAERRSLAQKHAMYTYKDVDLPAEQRFQVAFDILGEVDDLLTTKNQETLGLAGAICKYQWVYDAQMQNLERSLGYYRRGYDAGILKDLGYTAINAAFVLDLLASREEAAAAESGTTSQAAFAQREEAARIRREIIHTLTPLPRQKETAKLANDFWFLATVGEAYFGLRRYDEAAYWLREAAAQSVEDWQTETTARQLATLACTQKETEGPEGSPAWEALQVFLLNDRHALHSIAIGKVGLALSGGGFRASLFHIGVLARMAELDVLRHVEVLSCVSGGAIVGAHYYLEVRCLLETKRDEEVTRQDYIDIMQRIERQFLAGVQRNLRTRILAEWTTNLKTIFLPRYSRTERLAELYEEELYARVPDSDARKGGRLLNKLQIQPKDEKPNFLPKLDNWRRAAKVPQLVLNSSTLNTGHNWQFTATFMGEPPGGVSTEVDGNERLRRMYYWEAPEEYHDFRLGRAVAASACVPGLFEPVEMGGLFPERTLQLVDGGVHDNQGVESLLEQECSVLLVSDASGQMGTEKNPSQEVLKVPMRANAILMARVREAEYRELQARQKSQLLRGLMFVHLKKGLDVNPVDWVDCKEPQEPLDDARPAERRGLRTAYDVPKDMQEKLAGIRTDLDSFSDREAYGLMWSGYKMTDAEFSKSLSNIPTNQSKAAGWQFQQIERVANLPQELDEQYAGLLRALDVGKQRGLKIWRLSKSLRMAAVLALLACVTIIWMFHGELPASMVSLGKRMLLWTSRAGLLGFVMMMVVYTAYRLGGMRKPFSQVLTGAVIVGGGFLLARLHLWFFDPAFLNEGRIGSPRIPVWRRVLVLVLVLATLGTAARLLWHYYCQLR